MIETSGRVAAQLPSLPWTNRWCIERIGLGPITGEYLDGYSTTRRRTQEDDPANHICSLDRHCGAADHVGTVAAETGCADGGAGHAVAGHGEARSHDSGRTRFGHFTARRGDVDSRRFRQPRGEDRIAPRR